jgi:hypothetical protein
MMSNDFTYIIGKMEFQFPKDCHPNSKRHVTMNGHSLGLCPTEDLTTANQIARLISRAVHIHNAAGHRESGDAAGCGNSANGKGE